MAVRYCIGFGQEFGQRDRFCSNCGSARPLPGPTKANPAPTSTPEEILASLEEEAQVTYRFGPASVSRVSEEALSMVHRKNGRPSGTPATDALTLTVVTVR